MENTGRAGANRIAYEGATGGNMPTVQLKSSSNHPFQLGDEMRYQGFATNLGAVVLSNPVMHAQNTDELIVLVFPDWSSSDNDGLPCPGAPTITDIDGNVYNTVQIGNQCWMRENLRTTHKADGTTISFTEDSLSTSDAYYYDNSSSNMPLTERGYLYNWLAAIVACPTGWHLPSDTEWTILTDYLSSHNEYICGENNNYIAKSLAATTGWKLSGDSCNIGSNQSINNASGFGAVPAGSAYYNDYYGRVMFQNVSKYTTFWTSTDSGTDDAWERNLSYLSPLVYRYTSYRYFGYSVRCLRD